MSSIAYMLLPPFIFLLTTRTYVYVHVYIVSVSLPLHYSLASLVFLGASMGLAICFLLPPLVYIKLSFSSKANLSVGTHAGASCVYFFRSIV